MTITTRHNPSKTATQIITPIHMQDVLMTTTYQSASVPHPELAALSAFFNYHHMVSMEYESSHRTQDPARTGLIGWHIVMINPLRKLMEPHINGDATLLWWRCSVPSEVTAQEALTHFYETFRDELHQIVIQLRLRGYSNPPEDQHEVPPYE